MSLRTGWEYILLALLCACTSVVVLLPRPVMSSGIVTWGAFGELAGECWSGPRELSCFEWELPGEALRQSTLGTNGEQIVIYRLDVDGANVVGDDGSRVHAPRAGIAVRELAGSEPTRVVYRLQGDVLDIAIERQSAGAWMQERVERRTRATDAQVARVRAAADELRAERRKVWGVLADLAGRRYVLPGRAGYLFSWVEPGRVLRFAALHHDAVGDKVREITPDPRGQGFVVTTKFRGGGRWYAKGDPSHAVLLADGSLHLAGIDVRVGMDEAGRLILQPGQARRGGLFDPTGAATGVDEAPRDVYAALEQHNRLEGERIYQRLLEGDRLEAARRANSSDSGLIGALIGAAVGAYAGSAAGLDGAQTLDLMVQGAAAASGSSPVGEGLARGWREETAKQQAMQRSMEEATNRGLAQGEAEYMRRARASDVGLGHAVSRPSHAVTPDVQDFRESDPISASPSTTRYTALQGPGTGEWANSGTASAPGQASTRDDPSTCISPPMTSTHQCASLSGYKARVSNQCAAPVDIRLCFMTDSGWNCQSNYGVAPGGDWEPGWCHASTGQVFHASRYSDSSEPLASP